MLDKDGIINMSSTHDSYIVDDTTDNIFTQSTMIIYQWIMLTVVCQGIAIFGSCTNIVNIICFIKQGFKDPVNISLLGKV